MKIRTIVGVFVVSALMLSSIGVAVAEGNGEKQGGHQEPAVPGECVCWEGPPWDQTASITADATADCCRDRRNGRCCK